jgi:RHS repeat-associated protein
MPKKKIVFNPGGDTSYILSNGKIINDGSLETTPVSPFNYQAQIDLHFSSPYPTLTFVRSSFKGNGIDKGAYRSPSVDYSIKAEQADPNSTIGIYYGYVDSVDGWITVGGKCFYPNISSTTFKVKGVPATGRGWMDNCLIQYIPGDVATEPSPHDGQTCEINWKSKDEKMGKHPISLRDGEKREKITDLVINSAAEPLTFTRTYRQYKQGELDYMGLGWAHNHAFSLARTDVQGDKDKIDLRVDDGGLVKFTETSDGSEVFEAPASSATITYDSGTTEYTLEGQDKSVRVFDANGKLLEKTFANGEKWTYTYYTLPHVAEGELKEVADDYGRKLQFAYIDDSGQFDHLQLWRVGDHDATGLETGSPSGRYIEFGYTPEKDNGTTITSPEALLNTVRDVLGKTWTYDYYGQDVGESDDDLLNLLIEELSPSVDTDGDGSADGSLTLKKLTYAKTRELAVNGDMEDNSDWTSISGAVPTTNEQSITQVDDGTYSRHVDCSADAQGIEGNLWNLVAGRTYTITARVYPDSGAVKMQVTNESSFDATSTGTDAWETLSTTHTPTAATENHRLQFIASGGAADFYVDSVIIEEKYPDGKMAAITQELGVDGGSALQTIDYDFQPGGDGVTTEEVAGIQTSHNFWNDVYIGTTDALDNETEQYTGVAGGDNEYRPFQQYDAKGNLTILDWGNGGTELDNVTDAAGNTTQFEYNTNGTLDYTLDAEGRKTAYTYGDTNNPRQPTIIEVFDTDGTTLLRQQDFVYDTKGRTTEEKLIDPTDGTTVLQKNTRSYYTSGNGNGLLEKVTQQDLTPGGNSSYTQYFYDSSGRVIQTKRGSDFGDCCATITTYDDAANVLTTTDARDINQASDPEKSPVTTYTYDAMGRRITTTTNTGTDWEQTSRTFYDALNRVWRSISNYVVQGSSAPGDWVWDSFDDRWEDGSGNAISHGTEDNQNIISDTVYNDRGMVRMQRDVLGNATLYGYDDADRLVKTVQSAATAGYNNNYSGTSPDPDMSGYGTPSSDADKDIISEQEYDANGNLVKTTDAADRVNFTVYDELNRPVVTVRNAKTTATVAYEPGDAEYVSTNDPRSLYDPEGRYEEDEVYTFDEAPDRDQIERTVYDAMGRVVKISRLLENRNAGGADWDTTFNLYDNLGRQAKTIRNAKPAATIELDPGDTGYDATNDPRSSSYVISTNVDEDIISETSYDEAGRVLYTEDVNGIQNRPVYDGLGRQRMSIANYILQGGSDPASWLWDAAQTPDPRWEDGSENAISFDADNDQNIISATVYDDDGRVQSTRDVTGKVNYNVYDTLGRQKLTISNYVDDSYTAPSTWQWDTDHWEDATTPTAKTISHGDDNDQNIISETIYDEQGRAYMTRDNRGNLSCNVYDSSGRRFRTVSNYVDNGEDPLNWVWDATDSRWEESDGTAIVHGTDNDQNIISEMVYDIAGRVESARDVTGKVSRSVYDILGRRIRSVGNYVDNGEDPSLWVWDNVDKCWEKSDGTAIVLGTDNDQNIISDTSYNKAGQVLETRNARGTKTGFAYDDAGRRLKVTQDKDGNLETTSYTCYDKAGRVLRTIANWIDDGVNTPDDVDGSGDWLFLPGHNGHFNDQNRISENFYDGASRRTKVVDAMGNEMQTVYYKDGQVKSITDAENMVTVFRYDDLHRRNLVVQSFVDNGEDPSLWVWDENDDQYEESDGTPIDHNDPIFDENIIVQVDYDIAGRTKKMRDPRGNETSYAYDQLGRRSSLTNPLSKTWSTSYADNGNATYSELLDPNGVTTRRDFDRRGRLVNIDYNNSANTPEVSFDYDLAGNRVKMTENDGTDDIRITNYGYDDAKRLVNVGFDSDADDIIEETVTYEYDQGGLKTKMTLPGSLEITYEYDSKGQLIGMTDWDSHLTKFAYDNAGRHNATFRHNGLRSYYKYDAGSRLRQLKHDKEKRTLADFRYDVDGRGNRTQAIELLPHPVTTNDTTYAYDDDSIVYNGTWTDDDPYMKSENFDASMKMLFYGENKDKTSKVSFTFGTGPNFSMFDIYVGGSLWQSFDGYSSTASERTVNIPLMAENMHLFEIRNRPQHSLACRNDTPSFDEDKYIVQFKQLVVEDTEYDLHTIEYTYDALSRLLNADYYAGMNTSASTIRDYAYSYDRAGNRLSETIDGGAPTTYSYNAANQISNAGFAFDNNGNMTSDGTNTHVWDRANRLKSMGGSSYAYDGLGNRVSQTISQDIISYLLDVQPGLTRVIAADDGTNTERYIHGPRGIHAMEDSNGNWLHPAQDGLGSVRMQLDDTVGVDAIQNIGPYGDLFGVQGTIDMPFGFTGEQVDENNLVYLRARYYDPNLGVFNALDPYEGTRDRPMSMNGYSWVEGNVPNAIDPSGRTKALADSMNAGSCYFQQQQGGPCGVILPSPIDEECLRRCSCTNLGVEDRFNGHYWECMTMWSPLQEVESSMRTQAACTIFLSCYNDCTRLNLPFRAFDYSQHPTSCDGFSNPDDCLMYHLDFLINTSTIATLRSRSKDAIKAHAFASFMAPDDMVTHPFGSPGDIKDFYKRYLPDRGLPPGENCITSFGQKHGFDIGGNIAFGYVGSHVGYSEWELLFFAGIAQFGHNFLRYKLNTKEYDSWLFSESHGDDPMDQVAVSMGVELYNRCGTDCTIDQVEGVFNDFRQAEINATSESRDPACNSDNLGQ